MGGMSVSNSTPTAPELLSTMWAVGLPRLHRGTPPRGLNLGQGAMRLGRFENKDRINYEKRFCFG